MQEQNLSSARFIRTEFKNYYTDLERLWTMSNCSSRRNRTQYVRVSIWFNASEKTHLILMCFDLHDFTMNFRGPFGAIAANSAPPRPRQSPTNMFLVDSASRESSGSYLGLVPDHFA